MNPLTISQKIIQVLLYEGTSLKKDVISKFLNIQISEVDENIPEIKNILNMLGLQLIQNQNTLEISLSTEINTLINKNKIEELKSELSESALQTLATILYKPNTTKAEIDFIRGVDSSRSIKNLLTRGLIESMAEKNRKVYMPTTETLRYLNQTETVNLPDFSEISTKLQNLINGD